MASESTFTPREVVPGIRSLQVQFDPVDHTPDSVVELLGHAEDGVVRAGCSCYTSADEVQRLISGVQTLRQG